MKRYVISLFILCVLLTSIAVRAQSAEDKDSTKINLSDAGALQFQIGSNFTLHSFQDGIISYLKHTSPDFALRFSIILNSNYNEIDNTVDQSIDGGAPIHSNEPTTNERFGLGLNTQFMFYRKGLYDILFYCGAGPTIGYNYLRQEITSNNDSNNNTTTRQNKVTYFYGGLSGVAGVEWFFTKGMSLCAEYGASLIYSSQTQKTISESTGVNVTRSMGNADSHGFSFGETNVRFGLSVYF